MQLKTGIGSILSLLGLFIIDALVEIQFLNFVYKDIPIPFEETSKPIGSTLFSLTFFHVLLIVLNVLVISYVLNRFGYKNKIYPSSLNGKMDFTFLILFSLSGLLMWYYPIFLISFIVTGVYFIIVELKWSKNYI